MEKEELSFEEKMDKLEQIITELEQGNVSLEESINKYTEAMKLVNDCDTKLKSIEERVNKIVNENGNLEDFEVSTKDE